MLVYFYTNLVKVKCFWLR